MVVPYVGGGGRDDEPVQGSGAFFPRPERDELLARYAS